MAEEKLSGDTLNILKNGKVWHILDGGNMIVATFPQSYGEETVEKIRSNYKDHITGYYKVRHSKRYAVVVNEVNVDKLENILKNIF